MDAQEYPIRHFGPMRELAAALSEFPAQVLAHEYTYESFGSWFLAFKHKGLPLRLLFDGKNRRLVLQESNKRKAPYD
jgi:hypothetical protein